MILTIGSVMVGDDLDDRRTVKMRHKDCNSIGIDSVRRDLPAGATQAEVEAVLDELNADPGCTAYGIQQPHGLDGFALASRVDPAKDVDGLHPDNLGTLVLGEPGRCPVPRPASSSCSTAMGSGSTVSRSAWSAAVIRSGARLRY